VLIPRRSGPPKNLVAASSTGRTPTKISPKIGTRSGFVSLKNVLDCQVASVSSRTHLGSLQCSPYPIVDGEGNIPSPRTPLPSNRHHRSSGDCLEGKRENYQVYSVQYYVQQLYTMNCTHILTDLTVLWIGFCLTWPISLCLDSYLYMYYFVSDCILYACVLCSI